jgi:hypothetical protein
VANAASQFAVVILAGRASPTDRELVSEMVLTARAIGAHAVVAAVPRGWRAPPRSRVVHATAGAPTISALRLAMAQLGNSPARYALLWPLESGSTHGTRLSALVDAVARERPRLAAFDGDDIDRAPVMIARDAWLDLMTLGEQGLGAVAARCGLHRVAGGAI